MTIPNTTQRITDNTNPDVNMRIFEETKARVAEIGDDPVRIDERLKELDQEWDIERTLMANASTLALAGTLLGATVNKKFLWIPGAVTAFLLQHALHGWCPPMPLLRRAGVRTAHEIESERTALKALRGDFDGGATDTLTPAHALETASSLGS